MKTTSNEPTFWQILKKAVYNNSVDLLGTLFVSGLIIIFVFGYLSPTFLMIVAGILVMLLLFGLLYLGFCFIAELVKLTIKEFERAKEELKNGE
jgi:uncharacterized protein (DUF58 family)